MQKGRRYNKAVGYVRVSTEMQVKEGESLEAQRSSIMRYCVHNDIDLIEIYKDEGKSGKNMEGRPELMRMLNDIQPRTLVITVSLSRISRSIDDARKILKLLEDKGCYLKPLDMDFDTSSATGEMIFNMLSTISQFERQLIGERVSGTMQHMSRENKLQTKPKYGLMKEEKGNKKAPMIECPQEQELINRIKELIKEDPKIPVAAIVRILESEKFKLRKCKRIYHASVATIIRDNNLRD